MWEKITRCLNPRWQWLNLTWQNSRWLPPSSRVRINEWSFFLCKMAESKMVEFKMAAILKLSENEWVNFFCSKWLNPRGRIQNGWHLQVEWEWMSLSQIELVWVRVLCKMAESRRAEFKMDSIQDGCHHQVKVRINGFESDWISLSQSQSGVKSVIEWIWEKITRWSESKMAEFCGWIQHGRIQDSCHLQDE